MNEKLFRKKAIENFSSPDELNNYIKASSPGIWIILAAVLILLGAAAVWIFSAKLPITEEVSGIGENEKITCWLDADNAAKIAIGDSVSVKDLGAASISAISENPLSENEVCKLYDSDYVLSRLGLSDWNVRIELTTESAVKDGAIYSLSITTDEIQPIELIIN